MTQWVSTVSTVMFGRAKTKQPKGGELAGGPQAGEEHEQREAGLGPVHDPTRVEDRVRAGRDLLVGETGLRRVAVARAGERPAAVRRQLRLEAHASLHGQRERKDRAAGALDPPVCGREPHAGGVLFDGDDLRGETDAVAERGRHSRGESARASDEADAKPVRRDACGLLGARSAGATSRRWGRSRRRPRTRSPPRRGAARTRAAR